MLPAPIGLPTVVLSSCSEDTQGKRSNASPSAAGTWLVSKKRTMGCTVGNNLLAVMAEDLTADASASVPEEPETPIAFEVV